VPQWEVPLSPYGSGGLEHQGQRFQNGQGVHLEESIQKAKTCREQRFKTAHTLFVKAANRTNENDYDGQGHIAKQLGPGESIFIDLALHI